VFNWDVEQDVDLVLTCGWHASIWPSIRWMSRSAILKNGRKAELVVTRTEDSFVFEDTGAGPFLEPNRKEVELAVHSLDGKQIGTLSTSGRRNCRPAFLWISSWLPSWTRCSEDMVDLELRQDGKLLASGTSEVNRPCAGSPCSFPHPGDADQSGRRYAGIQISRDPGYPVSMPASLSWPGPAPGAEEMVSCQRRAKA